MTDDSKMVRLHANLTLLELESPEQLKNLEAIPQARMAIVRKLTPTLLVLDGERVPDLLEVMEKHGAAPRVEPAGETPR